MKDRLKQTLDSRLSAVIMTDALKGRVLNSVRKQKTIAWRGLRMFKWRYAVLAAAVCAAAAFAFFTIFPVLKNADNDDLALKSPALSAVPPETTEEIKIVSAYAIGQNENTQQYMGQDDGYSSTLDIPYSIDGSPLYSDALKAALGDPENDGALFDVWIRLVYYIHEISNIDGDTYVYKGLTLDEWHDEYITTLRAREEYKRQKHSKLKNVDNFDKWSGGSEEARRLEAQWDAEWEAMWLEEHPGRPYPMTALREAEAEARAALDAAEKAFIASELERLGSAGITLTKVPGENLYAARLTKEQALALPVSSDIKGYSMLFADEKDCTFNGMSIYNSD